MYQEWRPWVLCTNDCWNAPGWGVETAVRVATRSACDAPTCQATAPPQSWPTTCTCSRPTASMSATTSPASFSVE